MMPPLSAKSKNRPTTPGMYWCRRFGVSRFTTVAVVTGEAPYLQIRHLDVVHIGNATPADLFAEEVPIIVGGPLTTGEWIYGPAVDVPPATPIKVTIGA